MKQSIIGYHQDDENDWVAQLECGHHQHVRHNPPWSNREWVTTDKGREKMKGCLLNCVKCETGEAPDTHP
jgi:hypothetical protein